jgi:hypothetical protein
MKLLVTDFREYLIKTYELLPTSFSIYTNGDPDIMKKYIDVSFFGKYQLKDIIVPDIDYHSEKDCFRLMAHQIKFELVRTIIDKEMDLKNTLGIMFSLKAVEGGYTVSDKEDGNEKLVIDGYDIFGCLTPKLLFSPERRMIEIYRGLVIINTHPHDYRHVEVAINKLTPKNIDLEVFGVLYDKQNENGEGISKIGVRLNVAATDKGLFAESKEDTTQIYPQEYPEWLQAITNSLDVYENPMNNLLSAQIPLIKSNNLYHGVNLYVNTPDCVFILIEDCWIPSDLRWLIDNEQAIPVRIRNELMIYKSMIETANA